MGAPRTPDARRCRSRTVFEMGVIRSELVICSGSRLGQTVDTRGFLPLRYNGGMRTAARQDK